MVSELATNALRHGGGTFTLRLNVHPDAIEVAVDGTSPRLPRMRTPALTGAGGGFGWPMVNRLDRTTAITHRPAGGKTVTAPPLLTTPGSGSPHRGEGHPAHPPTEHRFYARATDLQGRPNALQPRTRARLR